MRRYSEGARQRAMARRITWWQAAEILGIAVPQRVPLETVEEVLRLYQEQYADFNVRASP